MSHRLRAFGTSLLIHLFLLVLLFSASQYRIHRAPEPLEIDLSLLGFEKEVAKTEPSLIQHRHQPSDKNLSKVAERPAREAQPSVAHPPQKANPPEAQPPRAQTAQSTTHQEEPLTAGSLPSESTTRTIQTSGNPAPQPASPLQSPPQAHTVSEKPQEEPSAHPQQQKEQYLKEKLSVISRIVQKSISYPPIARRMGWEGRVVLSIRLCEDGTLKEVKVAESSGYEVLDRNAVETVKKVAHLFPKPPLEVVVRLPVNYRLE